jgi:hypothetical protein
LSITSTTTLATGPTYRPPRTGKAKPGQSTDNHVSQVAGQMGKGASFGGFAKNAHPDYENAVWTYMKTTLGLNLPKGRSHVAKPGWTCSTV